MAKTKKIQIDLSQKSLIKNKLNQAGIKVHSGKKVLKRSEYSGIVGKGEKVLELKI